MKQIAVFASGSGTNFEAIAQACADGRLNARIALMVCDKPGAAVIARAERFGVESFVFDPKSYRTKADYEAEIVRRLDACGVALVCLAGYMRIVGDTLLRAYGGRIINIHPSQMVTTRVASVNSPWLRGMKPGQLHAIAVSHGEGKFVVSEALARQLFAAGQVAFQYADPQNGKATMESPFNPNGSCCAIEGIISPDGQILGKMGHTERYEPNLFKNISGEKVQPLFRNAVEYFRKTKA